MINLKTALNTLLRTIHNRVYFQTAPNSAQFPYLVYNLPSSFTNEEQEILVLDVDVWDSATDSTVIETLASQVWTQLHRYRHIDNEIQFTIHRSSRLVLDDNDPRIRRRKLVFQLRFYDRNL